MCSGNPTIVPGSYNDPNTVLVDTNGRFVQLTNNEGNYTVFCSQKGQEGTYYIQFHVYSLEQLDHLINTSKFLGKFWYVCRGFWRDTRTDLF